ncbi:hypothetical protein, partial [Treponema pallidum]
TNIEMSSIKSVERIGPYRCFVQRAIKTAPRLMRGIATGVFSIIASVGMGSRWIYARRLR